MRKRYKIDLNTMSTEEALYFFGLLALPICLGIAYFVVEWIVPRVPQAECIFWQRFGVYCPGCGGTRAVQAFLHGHFLQSLWYHPLVMYCAVMYLIFMLSHTLEKLHVPFVKGMKFKEWIMYGMLVVLVANFILKNYLKFGLGIVMLFLFFL